ncbi:MAG: hypothetical protein WDA74_02010 [Spirochaetota bacterium]
MRIKTLKRTIITPFILILALAQLEAQTNFNTAVAKKTKPSVIHGKLTAIDYDSSGKKVNLNPGQSDIEVWIYNPSAPAEKYIKKKTLKTDSSGNFNLGTEFDNESTIFLLSKNDDRSSAYTRLSPKSKSIEIKDFISEKYDNDNYVLVDTFHRGKQYYYLDNGYFYLQSGIVTKRENFFFPNNAGITRTNSSSAKLLGEIKAGAAAKNDSEIAAKMENVFQFLRTKTKNSMGTSDQNVTEAANSLFANGRTSPNHPLNRWPTFDEYADTYSKYGFIPTGNCTAWSHLTATLLYAAGIPSDKFFMAKFNYDMSWIVEHWVIALNIGGRWYSIDPQHSRVLKFNSLADFNNPVLNRDAGAWDYKRPFEAVLLPGSTISRVPYLGDPEDFHKILADRRDPAFNAFFNSFKEKWQKGNKSSASADIIFPLTLEVSFEGSSTEENITEDSFFSEVSIKEPFMYPITYEVDGENVILVHYGYEAQHYTLYFHRIKGSWKLVRVKKSED